jgi:hypothetical protein
MSMSLAAPALATTDSGAYGKHTLDCLGLLFGDPNVHETECGPFTQPPFVFPTGGSGAGTPTCQVGEVRLTMPSRPILVAGRADACTPPPCGSDLLHAFPDNGLVPLFHRDAQVSGYPVLVAVC